MTIHLNKVNGFGGSGDGGGGGGSSKNPLLIVDVSYNNDSIKGAAVKVDTTTKTTKSNGLAIFADTGKGEKQIDVQGSGFQEYTTTKQVKTTTVVEVELQPLVITFTVRDDEENLLQGASITFNSETKTTDAHPHQNARVNRTHTVYQLPREQVYAPELIYERHIRAQF